MEAVDYERLKEGNRTEGAEYQSNLTLTTWLRADKKYGKNYQILPEWVLAGALDDVVLKYKDKDGVHYRFLQAKHSSNEAKTLTFDKLFNDKAFKIEKYFESYEDFHNNFNDGEIEDLILFTNLALNEDVKQYVTALVTADDPIFHFKSKKTNGKTPIMHKFNQKFIEAYINEKSEWRRKMENNKKLKIRPIWTTKRKELFGKFCGLFKLATDQPNAEELVKYIKLECENNTEEDTDSATRRLKDDIRNWYNNDKIPYFLNSISLMGLAFIGKTKRSIDRLSSLKLQFKNIPYEEELKSFLQQSEENEFHLNTKGHMNVSLLKLFTCLEKLQQFDYLFCPRAEESKIDEFLQVLGDSEVCKILVCEMQSDEKSLAFIKKREDLINENKEKKLIFVINFNIGEVEMDESHPFRTVADQTHFQDLMDETQKELSERKIFFQGAEVAFNSIYGKEIPPTQLDIESWGVLIDKQIEMNKIFDEFDASCYISRTLTAKVPYFDKNTIQQELGDKHIVTYNNADFIEQIKHHPTKHVHLLTKVKEMWCWCRSNGGIKELLKYEKETAKFVFPENTLCQTNGEFVISDMAGYGKTTTTSYLANEMQKQHPNCWVTRLQPSHLSFDEDDFKLTPEGDVCKYDAFLMDKFFKLTSPVERFVFKQYLDDEESQSQLFLIFDGFDEIDGDYQKVILKALKYLNMKQNVKCIGITTRPQYREHLEEELQTVAYKLLPFSHQNKITFLVKFWWSRGVKDQNEQLREYSERLIYRISKSISDEESELTGIPLQMRMLGEIYEKVAIKYVAGDLKRHEIVAVDLFGLYEQFIRKKEDVLLRDKFRSVPGAPQNAFILKERRKIHTEFAIKVIFRKDYRDLKEQLKDAIDLGIIQQDRGEYSFIHRTFAEFLTAKYFLDYTLAVLIKVNSGQLMGVMCYMDYSVVRKFINCKLDYKKMAIELNKPEYREAIQNIEHQQFEDAMRTSVEEDTIQILCFFLELYWYSHPKKMKKFVFSKNHTPFDGGLLTELFRTQTNHHSVVIHCLTSEWLKSDQDALLQILCFLIKCIFLEYKLDCFAAEIATDLQDELEEKQLLSEERLKSILFGLSIDDVDEIRWEKLTIDYLKHLKMKHEQLFYSFLREMDKFVPIILSKKGPEIYEWIGEKDDPNLVFDILVVSLFEDNHNDVYISNLERYLNLISKYIRQFDEQKLVVIKKYLAEYARKALWEVNDSPKEQALQLYEFIRIHRDIISLEEFMQNIKVHKNFSLIENSALWGWTGVLKFILDAGDLDAEQVARLKLERFESFDDKIENILSSIRECSDEQLLGIARVRDIYNYTILSRAIRDEDKLRIEIFSSWITSGELFDAVMESVPMESKNIKMFVERLPQYKMRFFEINKNYFVRIPDDHPDTLSVLYDENVINKEEFLRLIQLQNDKGLTILFRLCSKYIDYESGTRIERLRYFLNMMKRKCTLDDIVRIFRMKNVEGKSLFDSLHVPHSFVSQIRARTAGTYKAVKLLWAFVDELNIVELKKEFNDSLLIENLITYD